MLRNAEIAILGLFCLIDSSKWPIIDFFDTPIVVREYAGVG